MARLASSARSAFDCRPGPRARSPFWCHAGRSDGGRQYIVILFPSAESHRLFGLEACDRYRLRAWHAFVCPSEIEGGPGSR